LASSSQFRPARSSAAAPPGPPPEPALAATLEAAVEEAQMAATNAAIAWEKSKQAALDMKNVMLSAEADFKSEEEAHAATSANTGASPAEIKASEAKMKSLERGYKKAQSDAAAAVDAEAVAFNKHKVAQTALDQAEARRAG